MDTLRGGFVRLTAQLLHWAPSADLWQGTSASLRLSLCTCAVTVLELAEHLRCLPGQQCGGVTATSCYQELVSWFCALCSVRLAGHC